jgi:biopolymer transport protein ExbD
MGVRLSGHGGSARLVDQNADINVTPFVDIMLVLLIIFMVAAPLATVSLRLDVPPARETIAPTEPLYVTVSDDGALYIRDQATSLSTLPADVCAALGGGDCRSQRIFVRADPETRYERFIGVMDHLNAEGFTKVGLVNEDID